MNSDPRDLIDGYFDDVLTAEQQEALSKWIRSDPQHARVFAQAALLHDRLRNDFALEKIESQLYLPRQDREGVCRDAGEDDVDDCVTEARPFPKARSSPSTLPREDRGEVYYEAGEGDVDDCVAEVRPSPKARSSPSTLPREDRGEVYHEAGEDDIDDCVTEARPSPKARCSPSTLPREGEGSIVWKTTAAAAVLIVGLTTLWFNIGTQTASAAIRELDRIIISSMQSKDRTYEIVVEDITTPVERRGERSMRPEAQRPPKPPLDKAILHVREGNQFVLIRQTADGTPFITGSNGRQSWAINTRGPVKVSSDIHHFDHDLPGHETSVPLTNLHEGLEQLKRSYHLEFSTLGPEEFKAEDGRDARLLVAVKKPQVRGPQRVEIAYESTTGRILRMRFVQMPYGPDRLDLRLSLLNESELPEVYFEHSSHHAANRKIEEEN